MSGKRADFRRRYSERVSHPGRWSWREPLLRFSAAAVSERRPEFHACPNEKRQPKLPLVSVAFLPKQ
jgi:hypothetical protein